MIIIHFFTIAIRLILIVHFYNCIKHKPTNSAFFRNLKPGNPPDFFYFSYELFCGRKVQLVLAGKDCPVVFRQGELDGSVVLVGAQEYSDGRVLVLGLFVAIVVVDIEL